MNIIKLESKKEVLGTDLLNYRMYSISGYRYSDETRVANCIVMSVGGSIVFFGRNSSAPIFEGNHPSDYVFYDVIKLDANKITIDISKAL